MAHCREWANSASLFMRRHGLGILKQVVQLADDVVVRSRASSTSAAPVSSPLLSHIKTKILMRGGPISIAEYMQDCLTSPNGGFYMGRDVFGRSGDFVTSPEISQLFGEMVGIWCVHTWMQMGRPGRLALVEMGPGRGTLMADLLRGTTAFRDFAAALEVHFVEVSPALRRLQWEALRCRAADGRPPPAGTEAEPHTATEAEAGGPAEAEAGAATPPLVGLSGLNACKVFWHPSLDSVPDGPGPSLYIAHEFFDALPVHQFVRDPQRGWLEKMVDVAEEGPSEDKASEGQPPDRPSPSPSRDQQQAPQGTSEAQARASTTPTPTSATTNPNTNTTSTTADTTTSSSGLRLVLSPGPTPAAALLVPRRLAGLGQEGAERLQSVEICAVGMATAEKLAQRIGRHGGAALVVDYGREGPPYGDSLVAIRAHRGVGILDGPGTADLSAWVDFGALRQAALGAHNRPAGSVIVSPGAADPPAGPLILPPGTDRPAGSVVATSGPVTQAAFLRGLGIETRLQWLASRARSQEEVDALAAGCARLLGGEEEGGMGMSYKVMAIHHSGLKDLAALA